jgi:hypothetical protein
MKRNRRQPRRVALAAVIGATAAGAFTASPASAYDIRYQSWSRVPDNSAGAVFRPSTDNFQVWDNVRDGVPASLAWNYKGVRDRWKFLEPQDGAQHTFNLNLREKRHVYFYVSSGYGSPSYISEYRVYGD